MSCESPTSSGEKGCAKNEDYLERRRRNNDSARKSREIRRLREQSAKKRMEELEEENRQLLEEIAVLRLEFSQLLVLFLAKSSSSLSTSSTQ